MSRYFQNLIALSTHDEDIPQGVAGSKLAGAVESALAQRRAAKEAQAADEILQAITLVEEQKDTARQELKRLRQAMRANTDKLDNLDSTLAYGCETNNFLPLLVTLGAVGQHTSGLDTQEFDKASKMPANWKPTAK